MNSNKKAAALDARESEEWKYQLMWLEKANYLVVMMAGLLHIARSGYLRVDQAN